MTVACSRCFTTSCPGILRCRASAVRIAIQIRGPQALLRDALEVATSGRLAASELFYADSTITCPATVVFSKVGRISELITVLFGDGGATRVYGALGERRERCGGEEILFGDNYMESSAAVRWRTGPCSFTLIRPSVDASVNPFGTHLRESFTRAAGAAEAPPAVKPEYER